MNNSNDDQGKQSQNGPVPETKPPGVRFWLQENWGAALIIVLVLLAAFWVGTTLAKSPLILADLRDQAYARGLITLLISIVTLVMGFVLVIQSFAMTGDDAKDRFGRAREVFTVLMGVLGTIVGFYFGSADSAAVSLGVAEIRTVDKQLLTYISGGTRPYRYSIISTDKDFKSIKSRVSEDGWIVETLEQPLKVGTTITVDVTDSKGQKTLKELDFATTETKSDKSSSAPPPPPQSTPPPATTVPPETAPSPAGAPGQ